MVEEVTVGVLEASVVLVTLKNQARHMSTVGWTSLGPRTSLVAGSIWDQAFGFGFFLSPLLCDTFGRGSLS